MVKELPTWTVQCEKPLSVKQTVYGLESGVKYRLRTGSEVLEEKVADTNGSLSFSMNLTRLQEKRITLAVVDLDNIPD